MRTVSNQKTYFLISIFFIFFFLPLTHASTNQDIHQTFAEWTFAFNHRQLEKSCALFSKEVIASYRGFPDRDYNDLCSGFKKIFTNKNFSYSYQHKIKNIYRSDNWAAVRITWHLKVFKNNHLLSQTTDQGLDILNKQNNRWVIVNYLAYPIN